MYFSLCRISCCLHRDDPVNKQRRKLQVVEMQMCLGDGILPTNVAKEHLFYLQYQELTWLGWVILVFSSHQHKQNQLGRMGRRKRCLVFPRWIIPQFKHSNTILLFFAISMQHCYYYLIIFINYQIISLDIYFTYVAFIFMYFNYVLFKKTSVSGFRKTMIK